MTSHLRAAWAQRIAALPPKFFHGSGTKFRSGDVIRPGVDVGVTHGTSPLWAFAAPTLEGAKPHIRDTPDGPHVYEVEPVDPASVVEHALYGGQDYEYGTQVGWRVVREVPPPPNGWWPRQQDRFSALRVEAFPWTEGPESDRCTQTVLMQFGIYGKKPRDGLGVLEALQNAGWTYRAVEVDGESFRGTVRKFYETHKEGKFYIVTAGHAMAVIDGLLVDSEGRGPDGRRVIAAFEIYRPGQRVLGKNAAWVPGPMRLPNGFSVDTGGDAVPGGYNGYVVAYAPDGKKAGYVDWQIESNGDDVLIAMLEVEPQYRRQGIGSMLIEYMLRYETPNRTINWGYSTSDGTAFVRGYRGPKRIDP